MKARGKEPCFKILVAEEEENKSVYLRPTDSTARAEGDIGVNPADKAVRPLDRGSRKPKLSIALFEGGECLEVAGTFPLAW
jgi:hypothetical protein